MAKRKTITNPYRLSEAAWEAAFACARKNGGSRRLAAMAAGVSYDHLSYWITNDPARREQWENAKADFVKTLEQEAYRRAVEGWDEPRMGAGGIMYDVRKFDTTLLALLLKANAPEKYREQLKIEATNVTKTEIGLADLSPASRAKLREILDAETGDDDDDGEETQGEDS